MQQKEADPSALLLHMTQKVFVHSVAREAKSWHDERSPRRGGYLARRGFITQFLLLQYGRNVVREHGGELRIILQALYHLVGYQNDSVRKGKSIVHFLKINNLKAEANFGLVGIGENALIPGYERCTDCINASLHSAIFVRREQLWVQADKSLAQRALFGIGSNALGIVLLLLRSLSSPVLMAFLLKLALSATTTPSRRCVP